MQYLTLIVLALSVAVCAQGGQDVTITRSEFENLGESFNWASALSDGSSHQQSGQLKQIGAEQGIAITGSYSWVAADGQTYTVNYVADENGFQPTGDHLPGNAQPSSARAPASRPRP